MSEVFINKISNLVSEIPSSPLLLGGAISIGLGTIFLLKALFGKSSKKEHKDELPPKIVLQIADFLYRKATGVQSLVIPPELQLARHAFGFVYSKALFVVNELQVADALAEGPKTAEQLASELHVNADRLSRILRLLVQVGKLLDS